MRRRLGQRQRGAMAVELILCMPVVLLILLGGLHLGRVLGARHRLAEATGYATRASAIAKVSNANTIRQLIVERMAGNTDCVAITVNSTASGTVPYRRLDVTATCALTAPIGGDLVGAIGPDSINVRAVMPF
jgi:Flp pilus assembly protein TadG